MLVRAFTAAKDTFVSLPSPRRRLAVRRVSLEVSTPLKIENPPSDPRVEQELAWLGDAVLALWARERVLRELGRLDTTAFLSLTSNLFLQSLGRPTRVEAEFGQVYRRDGLAAAFAYLDARIGPVYARQTANRKRQRRS